MDPVVIKTSEEITEVVKVILDPSTEPTVRNNAHQMLDNFRDNSPLCAKCGIFLTKCNDPLLRHFGFQLIEHYIKLHWNEILIEEKVWIKNSVMESIAEGIETVSKEPVYIKDALSRIVVELIKREWPQQWPTLLDEFEKLCSIGYRQTELILMIFLRLIEDIVNMQNVPDKRRKDIRKVLNSHIDKLTNFFWNVIAENYEIIQKQMDLNSEQTLVSHRLIDVALEVVTQFISIISIKDFIEKIGFTKLCSLLGDRNSRNRAALCLLNIFDSQVTPEDKRQLSIVCEEDILFRLTIEFLNSELDVYDEQQCFLLKILSNIFCALTQSSIYNGPKDSASREPANFQTLLNCVLLFIQHPSKSSLLGQAMLSNLLKDSFLSSSTTFNNFIPSIIKLEIEKIMKTENLFMDKSSLWKFSFEADDDEDFHIFFMSIRRAVTENLKEIVKLQPKIAFAFGKKLIELLLNGDNWISIIDAGETGKNMCSCWRTLVLYMDPVSSVFTKFAHSENFSILTELSVEAIELVERLLNFNTEDPTILSYALSCISSLFVFVSMSNSELCLKVLDKIFGNFVYFNNGPTPEILNLKRHCLSLLIKLSTQNPQSLFPHFDFIYKRICELSGSNTEHFTSSDNKIALAETIIILSKEFHDFDKQSYFIQEILGPISLVWMSKEVQLGISSVENFISILGVGIPFDMHNEDISISNELNNLKLCINLFNTALKRCSYPSDPEIAKKGNFIHPHSKSFNTVYYRNPTVQYIIPKLPGIFQLLKILNSLYDPVNRSKIHPSYINILDVDDIDKNLALGINLPKSKTRLSRIKYSLNDLYRTSVSILGCCSEYCTIDFYFLPSLQTLLRDDLFFAIQHVPDLRIKHLVRSFLQSYFLRCPETTNPELMFILTAFLKFMFQKLTDSWNIFKLKFSKDCAEQQTETDEIIKSETNRQLSRTHIDFIGSLLTKNDKVSLNDDSMEDDSKLPSGHLQKKELSTLGNAIINSEETRVVVICTVFDSLHWTDTCLNTKSIMMCELLFKQLVEKGLIRVFQEATYLLHSVFQGIQELGPQEINLSSLVSFSANLYEGLKSLFPEISQFTLESTKCDPTLIKKLDDLLQNPKTIKRDKQVKDVFRRVVEKIIGVDVGQQHKRNVLIKNLGPLMRLSFKENTSIFDTNENIGLCNLFAPTDEN